MPSQKLNEATRAEWRALGFFYDRDDDSKSWRIVGSVDGLRRLAELIRDYASNSKNDSPSEHAHFGPYMYLEIGTCSQPEINDHWIAGPLQDLSSLASAIESALAHAKVGQCVSLRQDFAANSSYDLVLEMRDNLFDPAKEDPQCWG